MGLVGSMIDVLHGFRVHLERFSVLAHFLAQFRGGFSGPFSGRFLAQFLAHFSGRLIEVLLCSGCLAILISQSQELTRKPSFVLRDVLHSYVLALADFGLVVYGKSLKGVHLEL